MRTWEITASGVTAAVDVVHRTRGRIQGITAAVTLGLEGLYKGKNREVWGRIFVLEKERIIRCQNQSGRRSNWIKPL